MDFVWRDRVISKQKIPYFCVLRGGYLPKKTTQYARVVRKNIKIGLFSIKNSYLLYKALLGGINFQVIDSLRQGDIVYKWVDGMYFLL